MCMCVYLVYTNRALANTVPLTCSQVYYRKKRKSKVNRQGQQQHQIRRHSRHLADSEEGADNVEDVIHTQPQPLASETDLLYSNAAIDVASGTLLPTVQTAYHQLNNSYHPELMQQQHHQPSLTLDQVVQMQALTSKLGDMSMCTWLNSFLWLEALYVLFPYRHI